MISIEIDNYISFSFILCFPFYQLSFASLWVKTGSNTIAVGFNDQWNINYCVFFFQMKSFTSSFGKSNSVNSIHSSYEIVLINELNWSVVREGQKRPKIKSIADEIQRKLNASFYICHIETQALGLARRNNRKFMLTSTFLNWPLDANFSIVLRLC